MMPYDRIFEPVVAGGLIFVGFNDADKVVAFEVRDGSEVWSFYADGPIRFSPVAHQGSLYVASDDGCLYCLNAADGKLRWRFRGAPSDRKALGNRRVISSWPARGGPVVADDTVYFAAGIWPFMGTFLYALDAQTGQVRWLNDDTSSEFQKQPHNAPSFAGVAPQGQLAIGGEMLLVPGGRSLPAGFNREDGKLEFFNFGGKGQGGSFVAADDSRAFVHTRVRGTMELKLPAGNATKLRVNEPVFDGDLLYSAIDSTAAKEDEPARPARVGAFESDGKTRWVVEADASGDLILAGSRLYAAGGGAMTAIDLPRDDNPAKVAWSMPVEGDVRRLLAAADRLFAVSLDGRIMAFGAAEGAPAEVPQEVAPFAPSEELLEQAKKLLDATGQREGYAFWFGVDDADLLAAVLLQSELRVVAVDPDPKKVESLRRRFDKAGLYGTRVSVHVGSPGQYNTPPYIAHLVVVSPSAATAMNEPEQLLRVYKSVRPYGGKLWIGTDPESVASLAASMAVDELPKAVLRLATSSIMITREGALPGAADWTHAYGNVANTVKSNDKLVKLPLGILWFGGPTNMDVLPRHGHGPSEQVVGGRLFIEGMNCLSARDVYTGRTLWKREFPDLGTYQVYFDETYANTPLTTAYNQVHTPGANARGTNFVATDEGVYLVIGSRCLLFDSASGDTIREFKLPADENNQTPNWGYVGVYDKYLLAGVGFGKYSKRLGYEYEPAKKKGVAWAPDHSGSLGLAAFDRRTGEICWQIEAEHSFLHNGIVAGGGKVYLLDKLPKRVEEQNRRRGREDAESYRLLAVDAHSGNTVWTSNRVFGTWLGYSEQHDLLLQAGAAASDRSPDEVSKGMIVHRGADGSILWEKPDFSYAGPCILHGNTIITNTTSYKQSQGAFNLLDGSPATVEDPVTGEKFPWRFVRTYGCNTAVASENLLTFRSGAAGFYDLSCHGGTGNFGGFKSGCTSNLIVANGVLNAPDYTRTCTCGYQNQTSLAMVSMPENEMWTYSLFAQPKGAGPEIERVGVNLGAPGDRLDDAGILWVNFPVDEGASPKVFIEANNDASWYRNHSSRIVEGTHPWVAASGAEGINRLTIRRMPPPKVETRITIPVAKSADDAEESAGGEVNLNSSDLELTLEDDQQIVGVRFAKVPLAADAKINRAYLQFEVDETSSEPTELEIRGQAVDDAPAFAAKAKNISSRKTTSAVVKWKPVEWAGGDDSGPDQRTPDISAILREILGRSGWKQDHAMALIVRGTGKRVATSFDGDTKGAPRLIIDTEQLAPISTPNDHPPQPEPYTVRLVFAEPDSNMDPGERVFDVVLQGQVVHPDLDIVARAGGAMRSIVGTWKDIPIGEALEIELRPKGALSPILSGVEIQRQE